MDCTRLPTRRSRLAAAVASAAVVTGLLAPAAAAADAPAPTDPEVTTAVEGLSAPATAQEEAAWDAARTALAEQTDSSFYSAPTSVPSRPGVLLRQEPMDFYLDPVKLVQVPATGTRIMYSSQDAQGRPTAITGTVLTPTKPWTGSGPRPVVAYAVGTQGLGDQCAPSRTMSVGLQYEGVGITSLLSAGYTVVATDYEGLGTEGTHTYMVRAAQAHAVLDSVRAAQDVEGADVTATSPVALAGYSQGGGASAAAAEIAPDYAPEINLKGAFAGAPPADLNAVANQLEGSLYAQFLLYAMAGHMEAYDLDPTDYLNERGRTVVADATEGCVTDVLENAFLRTGVLTRSGLPLSTLAATDPTLSKVLAEQRLGASGRAPEVPVMIAHSIGDDVIPYSAGRGLGHRWCAEGTRVRFDPLPMPTHVGGHIASLPRMEQFVSATLADRWTPDSCGWF